MIFLSGTEACDGACFHPWQDFDWPFSPRVYASRERPVVQSALGPTNSKIFGQLQERPNIDLGIGHRGERLSHGHVTQDGSALSADSVNIRQRGVDCFQPGVSFGIRVAAAERSVQLFHFDGKGVLAPDSRRYIH